MIIKWVIPKTDRTFEELRELNIENENYYIEARDSMITNTWLPLFQEVVTNYRNYLLLENIFNDKDIEGEVIKNTENNINSYTISRKGLQITYEYKNEILKGIQIEISYADFSRIGFIGNESLSMKEISEATLIDMLIELSKEVVGGVVKIEGNEISFKNIEKGIFTNEKGIEITKDSNIEDIKDVLDLYKGEVEKRNGVMPLYTDELVCPSCFVIKDTEGKIEKKEDKLIIRYSIEWELNKDAKNFLSSTEGNVEWESFELVKKLKEF